MSYSNGGTLSFATATADDLLSGGDNNITRHELTSATRNGAPLAVYLKKLPAAIGLRFASGDVDNTTAMVDAIANVLCNERGELIFADRLGEVANMPIDVFQELSGMVNEKILGAKPSETDSANGVNVASTEGEVSGETRS